MVHRKKRVADSPELRVARRYCFENSVCDPKVGECVFVGDPDGVVAMVNIALGVAAVPERIPDTPQGLVLTDRRCRGAFQGFVEEN